MRRAIFTELLDKNTAACYLRTIADALGFLGRHDHVMTLLDVYCAGFTWLNGEEVGPVPENTCHLTERWLHCFGTVEPARALDVCERLLPYLRRSIRRPSTSAQDRQRFVDSIRSLRRRVVQLAHLWTVRQPENATALRKSALLWDAELCQRGLVEEFLKG